MTCPQYISSLRLLLRYFSFLLVHLVILHPIYRSHTDSQITSFLEGINLLVCKAVTADRSISVRNNCRISYLTIIYDEFVLKYE
jgi:hypothetical protein